MISEIDSIGFLRATTFLLIGIVLGMVIGVALTGIVLTDGVLKFVDKMEPESLNINIDIDEQELVDAMMPYILEDDIKMESGK